MRLQGLHLLAKHAAYAHKLLQACGMFTMLHNEHKDCAFRQITLVSWPYSGSSLLARGMPWPMGEPQQVRTSRELCPAGVT